MMDWRFAEALEADTSEAVAKWWEARRPSAAARIPEGLVEDLQAARLALEDGLQRRLWNLAGILGKPQRAEFVERISELDPWHVLSHMPATLARVDAATIKREGTQDDRELIGALKERARQREHLRPPRSPSAARRRLNRLARGRGRLAAVLEDDKACLMLRFGASLCNLIEIDSAEREEPKPADVRAVLQTLSEAEAGRAAMAVLTDPPVGSDDRGHPGDFEISRFVRWVIVVVWRRHRRYRLKTTITRPARSRHLDTPRPDIQLFIDLLACHAPSKMANAAAELIKKLAPRDGANSSASRFFPPDAGAGHALQRQACPGMTTPIQLHKRQSPTEATSV